MLLFGHDRGLNWLVGGGGGTARPEPLVGDDWLSGRQGKSEAGLSRARGRGELGWGTLPEPRDIESLMTRLDYTFMYNVQYVMYSTQ